MALMDVRKQKEETMKTRILAVLLALMMISAGTAMANTLGDIVKRGELRVAVQSGAAPYAFVDKNGEHAGSMVDFARTWPTAWASS
jgi:polar amino acid transport system substrate-binding protein